MKTSPMRIINRVICVAALSFIGISAFVNRGIFTEPFLKFANNDISFSEMTDTISDKYTSDSLVWKNNYVDLNGLFARVTGKQDHNEVALMKNGMLTLTDEDAKTFADQNNNIASLTEVNDYLSKEGVPFIYVQAPYKVPTDENILPAGIEIMMNDSADQLVQGLSAGGVETLDLRKYISSNTDQIKEYFYKTDHHWTPDGAFLAFDYLMKKIENTLGQPLDKTYTDKTLWKRNTIDNWFLGYQGKRVGKLFAGTDPLIYYTPLFDTEMSCSITNHGEFYKGDFTKANIRDMYIKDRDFYGYNAYCVYIGGDYTLVEHRNKYAPNHQRILLIKDSFMLPLQAFLSTEFAEVDVVDPRYYDASSLYELIDWTKPDCVVMMKTGKLTEPYIDWGMKEKTSDEKEVLIKDFDIELLPDSDNKNNSITVPITLESGFTYQFSYDDMSLKSGNSDGVSVLLFDDTAQETVCQKIFDIEFCKEFDDRKWTFKIPELNEKHDYKLFVYAGVHGRTNDIGMVIDNISVSKLYL